MMLSIIPENKFVNLTFSEVKRGKTMINLFKRIKFMAEIEVKEAAKPLGNVTLG